ncbi:MAG: hypothetical protein IJD86_13880 [Clostridia bacterium]|nr:hypothetical protein [Clostridia bacterium]
MKVYGAEICRNCREFHDLMEERGFSVDYVDITGSTPNLREFLHLRDTSNVFDEVKERGAIGIPAFVNDEGEVTLDLNTALSWIGQEPVSEDAPGCAACK